MRVETFNKNEAGKDYVVGDIHGCFDLLNDKLYEIGFDKKKDRLFAVGDLVDRGPKSGDVDKWLEYPWFHSVMGNHEQFCIESLYDKDSAHGHYLNGGQWFHELCGSEKRRYAKLLELPHIMEIEASIGKVGIVHAECPLDDWNVFVIDDSSEMLDAAMWGRDRFLHGDNSIVKGIDRIYVGHCPVDEVLVAGNHVYLDTGAVFCGKLTVMEINSTV